MSRLAGKCELITASDIGRVGALFFAGGATVAAEDRDAAAASSVVKWIA